jgi:hypothetical protein
VPSSDESSFSYDPWTKQFIATVKQGTEWGRSVWVSTAPATDFGAFTEPELIFHADEQDKINRRERVKKILESPEYLSPAIVDDEDYIAEIYNMHVLPYQGFYIGFPTCGLGTSSPHSITPCSRSSDLILFSVTTGSSIQSALFHRQRPTTRGSTKWSWRWHVTSEDPGSVSPIDHCSWS